MKNKKKPPVSTGKVELQKQLARKTTALQRMKRDLEIEAALEVLRARTLAMQKSDELPETAHILYEQFKNLGEDPIQITIGIMMEAEGLIEFNVTDWAGGGSPINSTFNLSIEEPTLLKKAFVAWKSQKKSLVVELSGKALQGWLTYRNAHSGVTVQSGNTSGRRVVSLAFFSKGHISISSPKPRPKQTIHILERFASVFDLTYTRFLDLKKAESQAREAQIETALEKVRSRTMGMQRSDELQAAALLLFQQAEALGVRAFASGFNIWDDDRKFATAWMGSVKGLHDPFKTDSSKDIFLLIYESAQRGDTFFVREQDGEELKIHYDYMATIPVFKNIFMVDLAKAGFAIPTFQIIHCAFFAQGYLMFISYERCPEAYEIFKRFAKVFEQTYTRFLDLQKAEEQARESQIQLAMERVRARTMAMQHSNELSEAASLLFKQIADLGPKSWSSGFDIWEADQVSAIAWMSTPDGGLGIPFIVPYLEDPFFKQILEAKRNGMDFLVMESDGKELEETYQYLFNIPAAKKHFDLTSSLGLDLPKFQITHCVFFAQGFLMFITYEPVPEMWDIFKRFAIVFEQTYTRFLDLQKSEAQARESQIQLAMERVRARTMAMQRSDELANVATVLFQQVKALGVSQWTCGFSIWEIGDKEFTWYPGSPDGNIFPPCKISLMEHPVFIEFDKSRRRGDELLVYEKEGEMQADHYRYMQSVPGGLGELMQNMLDAGFQFPTFQIDHLANFSHGNLAFITYEHVPELHDVFKRFARVFEQTYTRFLDLQKSEAQARESQIQLALERVRARTMAMQRSDELAEVALSLFQQVKELGITPWAAGFNIWSADNNSYIDWITGPTGDFVEPYPVDINSHPIFMSIREARQRGDDFHVSFIEGEQIKECYRLLDSFANKGQFQKILETGRQFPTHQYNHFVFGAQVSLMFITYEPHPEAWDIFKRFGKVFEQTYTRFLDLQKVEAQAKESQIEAALERVRSRSMAMQKSEELREVIQVIYEQLVHLGVKVDGAGLGMDYWESNDFNVWNAGPYLAYPAKIHIPYFDHPQFNLFKEAKEKRLDFFTTNLTFEEKNKFWDHFFKYLPGIPPERKKVFYDSPGNAMSQVLMKNVILYIVNFNGIPYSDADNATLIRFGKVFEQTYTRFNDLKQAESQAVEAIKRASVDRVRAEIASMRTTNDLERITPLIWNELTTLGVPFIRCGVFIIDEEQQQVHTFLSAPNGKAMASFHLSFNTPGEISRIIASWQKKEIYQHHWDEAAFIEFTERLVEQGAVTTGEKYLTENRPTNLYLHFIPFLQGMLYVGNTDSLVDEYLLSIQALAEAFATAYARYEDFNKLESANIKIEKTLIELKQAQAQLVQSEKMASLGELTAGIAHEIQNPLNFVNNFSDVSSELLEEMKAALENGKTGDAVAIAENVKQNLEKILHHGKRADAIVKGMLQHSRESKGQPEPTDLNALADEYLRLSYQGLRAKDKAFNANLKTVFDPDIGKIKLVPQDIGRVLLNLYNNAFYAVSEKQKKHVPGYEPSVYVATRMKGDNVEISVKDNGYGIPEKVREKIFHPFFTTKPTGQGTGLGLSLSYDILRAHGGELKVETEEGEWADFIIHLPAV